VCERTAVYFGRVRRAPPSEFRPLIKDFTHPLSLWFGGNESGSQEQVVFARKLHGGRLAAAQQTLHHLKLSHVRLPMSED
jgi:hypothetical protein